jgi:energy-converting hydrogenase Eha subunit A
MAIFFSGVIVAWATSIFLWVFGSYSLIPGLVIGALVGTGAVLVFSVFKRVLRLIRRPASPVQVNAVDHVPSNRK